MTSLDSIILNLCRKGGFTLCEVSVIFKTDHFLIRHKETENGIGSNRHFVTPGEARFVARFDASGAYRPLKGAPTLPRDWELHLKTASEVRQALDYIYPGAIGLFAQLQCRKALPVSFSETASRQTGMYRIVGTISDDLADETIADVCHPSKCLRTILWETRPGIRPKHLPPEKFAIPQNQIRPEALEVPFLCLEPCNLLIAACRKAIKRAERSAVKSPQPAA